MKVVICGAGQVGFNIARYLSSETNDITVVDQSPELVRRISDTLDAQGVVGHASHPDVLDRAGVAEADILIAVTQADEVNMVACQVAYSLFDVPTRIARIRNQSYLDPRWAALFSRDHLPIDVIISPEVEVARAIVRNMQVPGAFDMIPMADDKVKVIGVRCHDETPVLHTPLRQLTQLFPDLAVTIVGVVRGDRAFLPTKDDQLLPGDEVYFVVDSRHVGRAMSAFGHEEPEARRVVVIGGGNIGLYLAQEIDKLSGVMVKVIERDPERARAIVPELPERVVVLNGNALEQEILEEANVDLSEMAVSVTDSDEVNILSALLAKRQGVGRTVALLNTTGYAALVGNLGIDVVVNPRAITVSTILQHVRRGRIRQVHSLREGLGEIMEGDAPENSSLCGAELRDTKLPPGTIVGAIVRDGEVIEPRGDTKILANDRVILFAASNAVKDVEKLFSVGLEYF